MFRLHETTRRRACRAAFVALCVAPTLATLAWILHAHRPWRVQDEQLRLSGLLHVDVRAADWRTPRPGVVASSSLQLVEPTAGRLLAELVDVTWQRGSGGEAGAIGSIRLDAAQLAGLGSRVASWIENRVDRSCPFTVDEVRIRHTRGEAVFEQVRIHVEHAATGEAEVRLVARAAGDAAEAPAVHLLAKLGAPNQTPGGAAELVVTLEARATPIPCWLAGTIAPGLSGLGNAATFAGTMQIRSHGGQTSGVAQGVCQRVSLAAVLPPHAAHQAEGEAALRIESLRWRNAEIVELLAEAAGEQLRVSPKLIDAASKFLDLGTTGVPSGGDAMLAIDRLGFRIHLNRNRLTITGSIADQPALPPGCIATTGGRALLMQGRPLYPVAWVLFTEGPAESWLPATRQAIERAAHLPLADSNGNGDRDTTPAE